MDYTNPFSAFDPSQFGEGKTALEMIMANKKQQMANPFIEMMKQNQQMIEKLVSRRP